MGVNFCVECLQDALDNFDEPEFFNSDQGSQYTSEKFISCFAGHDEK
ncbi:MAG: hypothetical protein LBU65_11280 [Planctomycetaceae bacterium]|jgi:putative transposase|nr:hypothetical protein [Planctomycetaceae bacterium]